jgi:hypothetical protein
MFLLYYGVTSKTKEMEQIILTSTNKVGLEKKIRQAIGEGLE